MRKLSIRQKLTLLAMASSTMALLLVSAGFITYELISFRKSMTDDLSTTAQIIGNQSRGILTFDGTDKDVEGILGALGAKPHIVAACLYKGNNLIAPPYFRGNCTSRMVPLHPGPFSWHFEFGKNRLEGFSPIRLNNDVIGAVYLQSDLGALYAWFYRYIGIIALFMLASSVVVYFFSSFLQHLITRPIFHLAQTARTVSMRQSYSTRARKESEDELGQLVDDFNEMLGQLERRDSELHQSRDKLEVRVQQRTREVEQQLVHNRLLNQITYAVAARYDFDSIIQVLLQQLEEHLPVDYGCVYQFDSQTESLRAMQLGPQSQPVADREQMPQIVVLDETPFRPCLEGNIIYEPDNRRLNQPLVQKLSQAGLLSAVAAPLMVEDRMFGLLLLLRRVRDGFSAAERDFIRGLSAHVALAVRQAQLHRDLQKAYNDLRQTQQAVMQQERLKALGQMASGIAHDINNALSPIIGFADLIQKAEPGLGADSKRHLRHIRTAGEDVAHIVSRLRSFYRPRDEKEPLQALDFNHLVEQIVDMTRPRWRTMPQSSGIMIEVQTELEPDLPDFAGNESEIREVFTNLILNAVDALPKGGIITIRTRAVKPRTSGKKNGTDSHIILEVSDTGIGMNEETRKRCLEPFFSTKGQRGTGLGLAIVYGVVERNEGNIEIESEPGKGTTMRLIFPVHKVEPAKNNGLMRGGKVKPLRALCIDDEPLLRELIKEMLERDGHVVETADNGENGVAAFRAARQRAAPFEVVITDLGMPYMDGREVAKIIKRESADTPVIMLTGWGTFMKEGAATPPQIDGILGKPPRLHEIREMFRQVTRSTGKGTPRSLMAHGA